MSTSPLVLLDFDGVVAPYDDPRSIPNTWPDWCLSGEGHWLSHSMLDQLGQIIWLSTQGAKPNRWCSRDWAVASIPYDCDEWPKLAAARTQVTPGCLVIWADDELDRRRGRDDIDDWVAHTSVQLLRLVPNKFNGLLQTDIDAARHWLVETSSH